MNAKLVGRPAIEIAQEAGFDVPADTKLIIGEATSTEISEPLAHEKLFHFLPTFEVELDGDLVAVIRKEFSFLHPRYRIDCEGWSVEGNLFGWDYQIYRDGELCGTISKEVIALTDTYVIDFDDPQDELMIVMLVLAIDAANCSEH